MLKLDWNILFTLINLVIFYFLMKRFLFKPIFRVMEKRKEIVNKELEEARNNNSEALGLKNEYEEKLKNADEERSRIIDEAKNSARAEYSRILGKAQEDAEKLKADAKRQIEEENEKAIRAAKEDIALLAIQAAEKVVGNCIDAKANSDIYNEFLDESSESDE